MNFLFYRPYLQTHNHFYNAYCNFTVKIIRKLCVTIQILSCSIYLVIKSAPIKKDFVK